MSSTAKCITESIAVPATSTLAATAGTNVREKIISALVANITANPATFTLHIVASGGSVGSTNMVLPAIVIPEYESVSLYQIIGQVLEPGDSIYVLSGTASALNFRCSAIVATK